MPSTEMRGERCSGLSRRVAGTKLPGGAPETTSPPGNQFIPNTRLSLPEQLALLSALGHPNRPVEARSGRGTLWSCPTLPG